MGIMTLPYGNDSDVHLSSEEVIDLMRKFNPFHYENGFIGTAAQYIEQEMEPLGLESAWIWLNPHGSLFSIEIYEKESQHIYKISKKYENLYPFGWLTYFEYEGTDKRKDRIRKFYDDYGFCGLKINIEDAAYTKFKKFRLTETFLDFV